MIKWQAILFSDKYFLVSTVGLTRSAAMCWFLGFAFGPDGPIGECRAGLPPSPPLPPMWAWHGGPVNSGGGDNWYGVHAACQVGPTGFFFVFYFLYLSPLFLNILWGILTLSHSLCHDVTECHHAFRGWSMPRYWFQQ